MISFLLRLALKTGNPDPSGRYIIFRKLTKSCSILGLMIGLLLPAASRAGSPDLRFERDANEVLFNDNWKFFKGEVAAASDPSFDDRAWRTLDLPHDWSIEGPFDPKLASCTAFLPCGIGWYRKGFVLTDDDRDKEVFIRFDGVSNHSTVWCNGRLLGRRPYGYSSFTYDLTPAVRAPGHRNVIAVRVDHSQYADSRWYAGSGIYRNVFLTVTNKIHVDTNGTYITTPRVGFDAARVHFEVSICDDSASAAEISIATAMKDADGKTVATLRAEGNIPAGEKKTFPASGNIPAPASWSPDHPVLYSVVTQVMQANRMIDQYATPFGIRTFHFDPNKGFSLNCEVMKLKGVCLHIDAGALGDAVPVQVWERRLELLREAGCNAIRCAHNPPAPEFLDLCDRMGFLVMDEAFDEWTGGKRKWIVGHNVGNPGFDGYHSDFEQWADTDIRDMVLRDRNHPSIILWSIGNEIDFTDDPFPPNSQLLPPIATRLIRDVKSLDETRPVTAACAAPATNLFKPLLDVEGYNYMESLYAADHAAHPNRILFGSENSQALRAWETVANNDFIAGQFLWTGADYLGEGGVWPSHGSESGLLNLANFKKNLFYFRKSLWTDAPMVYLSRGGLFSGRRSRVSFGSQQIICFTNCDRVELFHDGQSLGEKPLTAQHIIEWPFEFASGHLHAVGHKGSAEVSCDLQHPGPAAKLALHPDVESLTADGRGVAQVELDVTDADGTLVPDAAPAISCTLSGPARLLGIENGNTRSSESYVSLRHSAYQGRMMIYLQSLRKSGNVVLGASAPGLGGANIMLPVE